MGISNGRGSDSGHANLPVGGHGLLKRGTDKTMKKHLFRGSLAVFAFFALAGPALANDQFYSWTMDLRVVDNRVLHTMTAGALTHQGQVWTYSTDAGHVASPYQVNLDVYKNTGGNGTFICRSSVTPYTTFNVGKQFTNTACGTITAGDYFIVVWKTNDDGWNEKGQGDLITP